MTDTERASYWFDRAGQLLASLSEAQQKYAASDVLYLHRLRAVLDDMLAREGRSDIAQACFAFLPVRAGMDLGGFADLDIFHHL